MLAPFKSIRVKLTLFYSLITLVTLVVFGLVAYTYSSQQLSENLDRSLTNEVKWISNYLKPKAGKVKPSKKFAPKKKTPPLNEVNPPVQDQTEPEDENDEIWNQIYQHALLNPKKTMIEVTDDQGNLISRSYTVGEESLMVGDVPLNTIKKITLKGRNGQDLRVAATTTEKLHIYVAYPLGELSDVLDNLFSIFLVLIPIAFGLSLIGGSFLAYYSLRPVDVVTRTAQRITAENLDQQIPSREVNDELGRLIGTFNGMIVRLRRSFDQIKQFSVDASHELRTPLTIMRGEVELALRSSKDQEEYRRILASNLDEIVRLSAIIDELLTLSKADLGQHNIMFEGINLHDVLGELYEDCEIIAEKKHIKVEILKNENISIIGDKSRLRQLFLNLVDNAVKYTPEKGKVSLSLERQNGFALVRVKDTGMGIPKEEQQRIFDRFYRVDKARTRDLGGTGLGLSIAKWIVELHHGKIEVASNPGKGSTFTVFLPIEDQISAPTEK